MFKPKKFWNSSIDVFFRIGCWRREDKECEKFPYSAIGFIELIFDSVVSYRTGILIGANIVLTAGHNLYDYRKNPIKINEKLGSPKKIYFYPGLNGNKSKYKKFESETFYYPKDFPNKNWWLKRPIIYIDLLKRT